MTTLSLHTDCTTSDYHRNDPHTWGAEVLFNAGLAKNKLNEYKLIKEFRLLKQCVVYVYINNSNFLISNSKDLSAISWKDNIVAFSEFKDKENPTLSEMHINLNSISSGINFNQPVDLWLSETHKFKHSKRKLWCYILKLLPRKISNLYRMGVPTHLLSQAMQCKSTTEIKENVFKLKGLHPKLIAMPPTWHRYALRASVQFNSNLIDKLKPLQILKLQKLFNRAPGVLNESLVLKDLENGNLDIKEFLEAAKYLNLQSTFASYKKASGVVTGAMRTIGCGDWFVYPNRPSLLMYKYLYTFIHRRGSSKCTASFDLLLPYQPTR